MVALLIFSAPVGRPLVDLGRVFFAVDTATVQEPWSTVLDSGGAEARRPRNPGLADQGVFFYPSYRFVIDSWLRSDPPLWNPWIYAGVPAAGNPQVGVFDPQVLGLAVLQGVLGGAARDWGLALFAWLRLAAAATGAYFLARRLGLGAAGASLCGLTYGGSGFLLLWLNASPGHVAPALPWLLYFLDGVRGSRWGRSVAAAAACLALSILGGHPETAFFVGALGGLFALSILREDRRSGARALLALFLGTLLASVSLAPFLEYLLHSGAWIARRAGDAYTPLHLTALGISALAFGVVQTWKRRDGDPEKRGAPGRVLATVVTAVFLCGAVWLLWLEGLDRTNALVLFPDLFGLPGRGEHGYRGPGEYLERAAGWIPFASLALASSALFTSGGRLARRGFWIGAALLSWLLCLEVPGWTGLFELLPVVGLGATARLAVVSSLALGLLAGEGLESSGRSPRALAVLCLGGVAALTLLPGRPSELPAELLRADPRDGLVEFTHAPAEEVGPGLVPLEGWIHPCLPVAAARVRVERLGDAGEVDASHAADFPVELAPGPWSAGRGGAPEGARFFRASFLPVSHLDEGRWRFSLDLYDARGKRLGSRVAAVSTIRRERGVRPWTWAVLGLTGLVLVSMPTGRGARVLLLALAAAQVVEFARGQNPSVPREECFPETRTEQILSRELRDHRYLSAPGILPASCGQIRKLRCIDGYDALDVADFNLFRPFALHPGTNALLGWNARGVDLGSPAFRLLGVGALATHAPLEHPDWEWIAGPGDAAPEWAEVRLYRARDPLPRAFCVAERTSAMEVSADLAAFDPRHVAILEDSVDWQPANPMSRATVSSLTFGNNHVSMQVELDGDGLLVLTDQFFPGWRVEVDGEEREVLRADAIFRGVVLTAGDHRVDFSYRPSSLALGALLSAAALVVLAALCLRGSEEVSWRGT